MTLSPRAIRDRIGAPHRLMHEQGLEYLVDAIEAASAVLEPLVGTAIVEDLETSAAHVAEQIANEVVMAVLPHLRFVVTHEVHQS